jgi:hypothetical protein
MAMRYDSENRVVILDLIDLEHCSFDVDEFEMEAEVHGLPDEAIKAIGLLVFWSGGVVTEQTTDEALARIQADRQAFQDLIQSMRFASKLAGVCKEVGEWLCSSPGGPLYVAWEDGCIGSWDDRSLDWTEARQAIGDRDIPAWSLVTADFGQDHFAWLVELYRRLLALNMAE